MSMDVFSEINMAQEVLVNNPYSAEFVDFESDLATSNDAMDAIKAEIDSGASTNAETVLKTIGTGNADSTINVSTTTSDNIIDQQLLSSIAAAAIPGATADAPVQVDKVLFLASAEDSATLSALSG